LAWRSGARDRSSTITPQQNILGERSSQYISTSADIEVARRGYARDPPYCFSITMMARDKYKLVRGGIELGVVTRIEDDQPNHVCRFSQFPAFGQVRALFDQEVELLRADPLSQRWRAVRDESTGRAFFDPHEWIGKPILSPLILIRGEQVWWR
jgi:hypothetical protein